MISDVAVLELLTGSDALLDSQLLGVSIQQSASGVDMHMRFRARVDSKYDFVDLSFTEVVSFDLSYEQPQMFLDIWELKFLHLADGCFYLALDPDPSTLAAAGVQDVQDSDTDGFYVRARHVEAVVTLS